MPLALAAALLAATAPAPASPALTSALDQAVSAAAERGLAGEVRVARDGRPVYARAVSAPGRPHRLGERWRWASVSKQLAGILTMQQVAAGKLSLDDTVATRLPVFKGPTAARITLRMLLQHTSGLPNPTDTPQDATGMPAFYVAKGDAADPRKTALGFCAGPPASDPQVGPDARFSYNNCDTLVLQAALERSAGLPFARLVHERLARPLGLTGVGVFPPTGGPPSVKGLLEDGKPEPTVNLGAYGASGGVYGPPEALERIDLALMDGRLLPEAQRAELWKGDPRLGYVALGAWSFAAPLKGCGGAVKLVERRGEIGGVEVRNLLAPERRAALVVFADKAGLDFGEIWQGRGLSYDLASAAFCAAG